MAVDLIVRIQYLPPTGTITSMPMPNRVEEFSGTSADMRVPDAGQEFFQLSKDNNPVNASYQLTEGIPWRKRGTKYGGFVSFSKSNKDKIFETASDVTITFSGADITGFAIYFDATAQQWATELTVNGKTYTNTGFIFAWKGDSTSSVTIVLKKWNRANVSARITSISVGLTIDYTKEDFTLVERGHQVIEDNKTLSWGILGQYGSIRLIDNDLEIQDLATVGILTGGSNIPISIILDNYEIGNYLGDNWSYEFGNNVVSVALVSNINKLNNTVFIGYAPQENKTNLDMYNWLSNRTIAAGFTVDPLPNVLSAYLSRIAQPILEMSSSTLLEAWTKFAEATSTRFMFTIQGHLTLVEYPFDYLG